MTLDQITQLRIILERTKKTLEFSLEHKSNGTTLGLEGVKEALALLPCPTCNNREKPLSFLKWQSELKEEDEQLGHSYFERTYNQRQELYQMYVKSFFVCPDCQPKVCKTCNDSGVYEHTIVTGEKIIVRCFHDSDSQPCKTCNGTRQCKDPKAGNSNMLTLMECPDCR